MNTLALIAIFLMTVIVVAILTFWFLLNRQKRKAIRQLKRGDKVLINGVTKGEYRYQLDSETHYINVNNSLIAVHFKDFVKILSVTILLLISTISFSQPYINLEWPRYMVKAQNRDKELIYHAKDYLEYKIPGGYIAYEFTDRLCTTASICLDSIAADSLIQAHEGKNWQLVSPDKWLYFAGYANPVKVQAEWIGGNVIFRYEL